MFLKAKWVKSHQDEKQLYVDLSFNSQQNYESNKLVSYQHFCEKHSELDYASNMERVLTKLHCEYNSFTPYHTSKTQYNIAYESLKFLSKLLNTGPRRLRLL